MVNLNNSMMRLCVLWRSQFAIPTNVCRKTCFFRHPQKIVNPRTSYFHTSQFNKQQHADKDADKYPNEGIFSAVKRRSRWIFIEKHMVDQSSRILYEACSDNIDFKMYFEKFNLDDTFISWFLLTELHVWMCLVRTYKEGEDGIYLKYQIIKAMWEDVKTRISKLGPIHTSIKSKTLEELNCQFQAAICGYDEGLLGSDKILAAALWRNFFSFKCNNPEHLEVMVQYVRMQISNLDSISRETFFLKGEVNWLPFKDLETPL